MVIPVVPVVLGIGATAAAIRKGKRWKAARRVAEGYLSEAEGSHHLAIKRLEKARLTELDNKRARILYLATKMLERKQKRDGLRW